ncbi:MAG: helix-turn-helix domain-containing protein [Phenylobacterium sp.]
MLAGKALFREITREVAEAHKVGVDDILGPGLFKQMTRARQETAWRLRQMRKADGSPRFSLPQIGAWLGGRDHTTILHAIRAHEQRMGGRA